MVVKRVSSRGKLGLLLLDAAQAGEVKVFVCCEGVRRSVEKLRKYVVR